MPHPSVHRLAVLALVAALAALPLFAQTKAPSGRSIKEIGLDLGDIFREVDTLGSGPATLLALSAAKPDHAAKVIAALKKRHKLYQELLGATVPPPPPGTYVFDMLWGDAILYALHDDETIKAVDAGSKAQHPDAKLTLAVANWYLNAKKPDEQTKIIESLRPMVKSFPADDTLGRVMIQLESTLPAKPEVAAAVDDIILKQLRSPSALHFKTAPHLGKPFSVTGTLLDGSPFTSTKFKGKVVLIHFWSPEHGPSRAEMAALQKLLDTYKDKGLEIVGVISEATAPEASHFLAENKYTWPQLFDPHIQPNHFHPLVLASDIIEENEVIIIDRAGNYRATSAREHLADLTVLVPQILAEKPAAATSTAPASAPATQLFH